jgi:hypothetical protein
MAHFPDLGTATQIASGPHVRAIGWLSAEHPYAKGFAPLTFVDRLRFLCDQWGRSVEALHWGVFAGFHTCEFCKKFRRSGNLGVPAGTVLFVAPEMVVHYVAEHDYLPPQEFVDAVLAAPDPGTEDYRRAVQPFIARRPG